MKHLIHRGQIIKVSDSEFKRVMESIVASEAIEVKGTVVTTKVICPERTTVTEAQFMLDCLAKQKEIAAKQRKIVAKKEKHWSDDPKENGIA